MNQAQQPEALRLAQAADALTHVAPESGHNPFISKMAATIRAQHALSIELADQLAGTKSRIAELETLLQAAHQDIANGMAALAALKAAPAAQAVEPAAVATIWVEESGVIDFEVLPPCTLPPGEYSLYTQRAAPAPAAVAVPEPEAWRYTDSRGHYRYRGMRPGFAVEYPMLKPEPLYTMQQVRAMLAATPPAQAQEKGEWTREVVQGSLVIRHPHGDSYEFPLSLLAKYFAPQAQDVQRYRLLERGEIITATDEFLQNDSSWEKDESGIWVGAQWSDHLRPSRRAIAASAAKGGA